MRAKKRETILKKADIDIDPQAIKCQLMAENHEQEEMCTELSVTCGILMNLKNVKVEKNQMKTEGMKRKIVPVDKKVQKVGDRRV